MHGTLTIEKAVEIKNAILEEKNGLDAHKIKVWHHKEKKQQQYCCLK